MSIFGDIRGTGKEVTIGELTLTLHALPTKQFMEIEKISKTDEMKASLKMLFYTLNNANEKITEDDIQTIPTNKLLELMSITSELNGTKKD